MITLEIIGFEMHDQVRDFRRYILFLKNILPSLVAWILEKTLKLLERKDVNGKFRESQKRLPLSCRGYISLSKPSSQNSQKFVERAERDCLIVGFIL